jgi:hypothetical protein
MATHCPQEPTARRESPFNAVKPNLLNLFAARVPASPAANLSYTFGARGARQTSCDKGFQQILGNNSPLAMTSGRVVP